MQLKLLNIHKLLSNIATNLVGAFVPVIVFEATGSLLYGVLAYIAQYIVRMTFAYLFRKPIQSKPQIMLVIRIIPILLYNICVILIEHNLWLGVVGVVLFLGMSNAFKLPTEFILNYSSLSEDNEGSLGFSRLIEQVGIFISFIVGGYLLQTSKVLTVAISIVIYSISVVPLVMYYIKCREDKTFNKDAISNASITFQKDEDRFNYGKVLSKKLLVIYGTTYFVYCFLDGFASLFNMHLFAIKGSYAITGIMNAIYNVTYGVGNLVYGKVAEKRDIQTDVIVSCVLCAVLVGLISFLPITWLTYVAFAWLGFAYAPICLFNLQRLLSKSRILGNSNSALYVREQSSNLSVLGASIMGVFGTILPCFAVIMLTLVASAALIPYHEEKSRRLIVDNLQYNEIRARSKNRQ